MASSKDNTFWENTSDRHLTNKMAANMVVDLQSRIEELEQLVKDKENQLQALQNAREADILCLQTRIDEMQALAMEREKNLHTNMTALQDSQVGVSAMSSKFSACYIYVYISDDELNPCFLSLFLITRMRL
jgi:hypothetical protein